MTKVWRGDAPQGFSFQALAFTQPALRSWGHREAWVTEEEGLQPHPGVLPPASVLSNPPAGYQWSGL